MKEKNTKSGSVIKVLVVENDIHFGDALSYKFDRFSSDEGGVEFKVDLARDAADFRRLAKPGSHDVWLVDTSLDDNVSEKLDRDGVAIAAELVKRRIKPVAPVIFMTLYPRPDQGDPEMDSQLESLERFGYEWVVKEGKEGRYYPLFVLKTYKAATSRQGKGRGKSRKPPAKKRSAARKKAPGAAKKKAGTLKRTRPRSRR